MWQGSLPGFESSDRGKGFETTMAGKENGSQNSCNGEYGVAFVAEHGKYETLVLPFCYFRGMGRGGGGCCFLPCPVKFQRLTL